MQVKHPVLKYYGSKFALAEWIINHFPAHRHYVEPFGGAANVLLVKQPSRLETYNDLNNAIVNFFRMLRCRPSELIEQIRLTPWARTEYEYCLEEKEDESSLEMARRLFYRLWMSFCGQYQTEKGSWSRFNKGKKRMRPDYLIENLTAASERLLHIQIENRDAFKLIAETDSPDTLFYLDPPYVFSTRTTSKAYSHELTNEKHREFAQLLYSLKGFVVLSGYPSAIYEELFEQKGWIRIDRKSRVSGGATKTECLWLNPKTAKEIGLLQETVIK
ncbi:MAG TPA: DNA adenine methylase [Pyrinomonadaceae bacterium]|jgi:DNA adenine methylase